MQSAQANSRSIPDNVGFVDTHIHLLPGLDDGPADMETSVAMAEVALADGVTHILTTPHSNFQWPFQPEKTRELQRELQRRVGPRLELAIGCELHMTFENVQNLLAEPTLYSLNGGRYVLVEFPEFFDHQGMRTPLEQMRQRGLVPVLAHPERNPVFLNQPETLYEYLRLGCLTQVTASSFFGRFGKQSQQNAEELLRRELIHTLASDGHSPNNRKPVLSRAAARVEELADRTMAEALTKLNPWALFQNTDLPHLFPPPPVKKSLWARLRS